MWKDEVDKLICVIMFSDLWTSLSRRQFRRRRNCGNRRRRLDERSLVSVKALIAVIKRSWRQLKCYRKYVWLVPFTALVGSIFKQWIAIRLTLYIYIYISTYHIGDEFFQALACKEEEEGKLRHTSVKRRRMLISFIGNLVLRCPCSDLDMLQRLRNWRIIIIIIFYKYFL